MSQDLIYDAREYHVFIPAAFDDLGLTLEAYRVYCHLARRASREGRRAYPSYVKIGEACFRGSYPNSSKASLKAKAIAAVDELIAYGLIRKELYDEGEGYSHNIYHLTPQSEWKQPQHISSCNVRKGRTGLQRNRVENSVNPDNPPVNPDNSVNRDETRLTPLTPPVNRATNSVNPTPPKGITNTEGNTNKGNTIKELSDFDKSDGRDRAVDCGKKKTKPAKDVYESLEEPDKFDKSWSWYCRQLKKVPPDRDGRVPSPGSKKKAAIAWRNYLEIPNRVEEFRVGAPQFDFRQVGIPHFERFISQELFAIALEPQPSGDEFIQEPTNSAIGEPDWLSHPRRDEWLALMDEHGIDFIKKAPESERETRQAFVKWVVANRSMLTAKV